MAADDFFARWSKRRPQEADVAPPVEPEPAVDSAEGLEAAAVESLEPPTMEEVSLLTRDSDYSRFVARDVDEGVKRAAMKKLFSDPHFNLMDGLDTYIEDYNTFEPISPEMLRALNHGKALLDPLAQLAQPLMQLVQKVTAADTAQVAAAELPNESAATDSIDVDAADAGIRQQPSGTPAIASEAAPVTHEISERDQT
ncbi:MAG TPA: DUF3306 domain-containing protein [Burkholderiaceae bacterium]|nr:DUF3306 domain-containing protein [Burkholderiaceae bacterium]